MAQYTIDIPDRIRSNVETLASASGHPSVETYLQSLVFRAVSDEQDQEVDYGPPPGASVSSPKELENLLKSRLNDDESTDVELTDEFFDRLEQRALNGPPKPERP